MQITEFKSIVATFADPGTELECDATSFAVSINAEIITGKITQNFGDIYVDDGNGRMPASKWVVTRLARLELLASRLRETVPATEHFVSPAVTLLQTLAQQPDEQASKSCDGLNVALETLNKHGPLETMVLYVTSDAGEGKTSLINQLARQQAQLFLDNKADWLLVPIPLGGRHFLRFDDITVGVMQNRYRFSFLYYQSFLALVKMGVIVPAFDGFEEMFVESSSGEALSAMGILVGSLDSRGAMVVAARKAYFEFENLRTQERLFDTIKGYSVGFGKLELNRWEKQQFIDYCTKRSVDDPEQLYERVSERLDPKHALLTRAVLVKRLVDVATKSDSLDGFLDQLQKSGADFFSTFVRGLIEREAREKWLDRSGEKEVGTPLLTVDEHCELLSQIALEMWTAKVGYLKRDALEFTTDFFCEVTRKNTFQAQQVRERIRGHAMLIPSTNAPNAVEFDHEEFQLYFLGEGIARQLRPMTQRAKVEVLNTFRRSAIPEDAMQAMVRSLTRDGTLDRQSVVKFLLEVAVLDTQASYTHENAAELVIRLLSNIKGDGISIPNLTFGHDALRDKKITGVIFKNCFFSTTSLDLAEVSSSEFIDCKFTQLRVTQSTRLSGVVFDNCTVDALALTVRNHESWNPAEIQQLLEGVGVTFRTAAPATNAQLPVREPDEEIVALQKLVRYFMRSTHMSESVILMKLSPRGQAFIDDIVPQLLKHGVLEEIQNLGGGDQRRFRLGAASQTINAAITEANGDFSRFLARFN
ncbi:MAG: hypothetical protein LC104_03700 [Bacteroidales bacterium]|nr:hypothetical protein [Bacteroidales bacterium]